MTVPDLVVVAAAVALIGALAWFFFGPRRARAADLVGGVQEVKVTVKGGYAPDLVRVRQGVPLRIVFDRQESGECTSRVVFPDFALNRSLSAYSKTTVELLPDRPGEFGFACGMNMIHGKLVVEPHANGNGASPPVRETESLPGELYADKELGPRTEDNEMAERKAEITDLTRRVVLGAVLTAPVLFSVMAGNFLPVG